MLFYSSFAFPQILGERQASKTSGKRCRSRNSVLQDLLVTVPNEMLEWQALALLGLITKGLVQCQHAILLAAALLAREGMCVE